MSDLTKGKIALWEEMGDLILHDQFQAARRFTQAMGSAIWFPDQKPYDQEIDFDDLSDSEIFKRYA